MTFTTLNDQLKFLTGQDSLKDADAIRLFNFALDDYSNIALTSSGRWRFDDQTHENENGDQTFPIGTTTLSANTESIPLATDFLMLSQVQIQDDNGDYKPLDPIDTRDRKSQVLGTEYKTNGMPRYYDFDSSSLFFYPKSDVSRGVKILYSRASPHITALTQDVGIPSVHTEYLTLHASHRLGFRTNDSNREQVRNELALFEQKIRDFYGLRDQDSPRTLTPKIPSVFK